MKDEFLENLIKTSVSDTNVKFAQEIGFKLKDDEIDSSTLELFKEETVKAACEQIFRKN